MNDTQTPSRSGTPSIAPPLRRPLEEDHTPAVSSPLNPDSAARARPARPVQREQREKRETLKKREASGTATRGGTPDGRVKEKKDSSAPSPMRYSIPEPKQIDYEPSKDPIFVSHEPNPIMTPDGSVELKRPVEIAWNKKAYRYTHCVADPYFRHKQFYRQSEARPYGPRMSIEDSDKWFHFDETCTIVTNEKGWRMGRGNVVAREGKMYYEVKILRGVPAEGPVVPPGQETTPQPHIRMGWARREAPLDAPVGFDGFSYGITDIRLETMHRSRSSKIYNPLPKKKRSKTAIGKQVEYVPEDHLREGDVIGLEINLPSLSLHRKVVDGIYNPAVDIGDGFNDPETPIPDIIRDRIPVAYKGNFYFEQLEYQSTKPMESYSDRGPVLKVFPNPNHDDASLRSLPYSSINVYKNGQLIGTAFEDLIAFLPPASAPLASAGARIGFDDGMLGYFPAISAFSGGIAQVNFGPDFWYPPPPLAQGDTNMSGNDSVSIRVPTPGRNELRAVGERFKEQIVEDIVWDLVDEVDFWVQDGGYNYKGESEGKNGVKAAPTARGIADIDD